jgi:hypothetical protein
MFATWAHPSLSWVGSGSDGETGEMADGEPQYVVGWPTIEPCEDVRVRYWGYT